MLFEVENIDNHKQYVVYNVQYFPGTRDTTYFLVYEKNPSDDCKFEWISATICRPIKDKKLFE